MYINYVNYKGGINNLCVVFDNKSRWASSIKGKYQAIKNFERKYKGSYLQNENSWGTIISKKG